MADKLLKSIKFPTLPDRYVIGDSTLTEEGAAADAKAVGDALAKKADTKGTYEDLIVGGAEQLMADEYETDSDPYLFRPTGGSADVGNREYLDKIVGGTVGWNQLAMAYTVETVINGVTLTPSSDDGLVLNGTTTQAGSLGGYRQVQVVANHKYLLFISGTAVTQGAEVYANIGGNAVKVAMIRNAVSSGNASVAVRSNGDVTYTNAKAHICCFDLTAMFGTTIADYIYSLEQSQAGAGVAWFRNYFPKDYYPYDPGTLRSVEGVSAHETVGFNQWDEEWELGAISTSTGGNYADNARVRSKNYIPILPNTQYWFKRGDTPTTCTVFWYDANKNFISSAGQSWSYEIRTTPANAHYMRFFYIGTTYNHDICINLSDPSRNGEYEPYTKHSYPLDSSLTLRGVPRLVDGKLAFDGDVYPPSGEVQRRYGVVDLGTLNWTYDGDEIFRVPDARMKFMGNGICAKYKCVQVASWSQVGDGEMSVTNSEQSPILRVHDSTAGTDATAFKTAMSGVYLVYELATPTTETADGYEHYQICDPSGTEEFVTDSIVPVGHETRYPHDLKKKIETAPDNPSTDGTYLMKRSGGKNAYMALPSTPSANGSYVLTVTVSGGNASYSWTKKE